MYHYYFFVEPIKCFNCCYHNLFSFDSCFYFYSFFFSFWLHNINGYCRSWRKNKTGNQIIQMMSIDFGKPSLVYDIITVLNNFLVTNRMLLVRFIFNVLTKKTILNFLSSILTYFFFCFLGVKMMYSFGKEKKSEHGHH